jgi:1-acyl-sn-glycerol-3-phosphate acyltransferase
VKLDTLRGSARLAGFAGLTVAYGARLLVRPPEPTRQARITHAWGRAVTRTLGLEIEIVGQLPQQAALLVSNHRSYADIAALAACTPVTFVAKAEVLDWPVIGAAAARAGTLFVRRGDTRSGAMVLRRMRSLVGAGVSIVVFPEGTTCAPPGIGPFQRGAFQLAAAARLPIIPVAIEYGRATDAWTDPDDGTFTTHLIDTFGRRHVDVRLAFGERLTGKTAAALHDAAVSWIEAHVSGPHEDAGGALPV